MGERRRKISIFIILASVIALCLFIGYLRTEYRNDRVNLITVYSENGEWDLTKVDFSNSVVRLSGNVEHIEGELLTPNEFEERESEAEIGDPIDHNTARTARLTIYVPDDERYAIETGGDYARSVFVNGKWEVSRGTPGETKETYIPGYKEMFMEVEAEDNKFEMVVQGGNFVHREGSSYSEVYIGHPENLRWYFDVVNYVSSVEIGMLFALALVHFLLALIFHEYQLNIRFSFLCLTWGIRLGLGSTKLIFQILPDIPWDWALKTEYLTIPLSAILIIGIVRKQYGGVFSERVFFVANTMFKAFALLFVFIDTYTLSHLVLPITVLYVGITVYITARLGLWIIVNGRRENMDVAQVATLFPLAFLFIAAVQEGLAYNGIVLFNIEYTLTESAILGVVFCETIFLFYITMEAMKEIRVKEEESRRKAEELERFLEMKSRFLGIVAHEVKTPLSIVMGGAGESLDIIRDIETYSESDELKEELNDIKNDMKIIIKTAKNLNQTVFDLLDITALETGRLSLSFNSVDLKAFILDVRNQYGVQLDKSGNQISLDLEDGILPVRADEKRLRQVMFNLLSNAIRHTKGGEILIRLKQEKEVVYIEVNDTGDGIKKELLEKLTKEYIDEGSQGYRGGIGLYVCQQVIESHGGKFKIQAEEGKGTCVRITLKKESCE